MNGRNERRRLEEIEAWMTTTRLELDDALKAAGVDPETFRRLGTDVPHFTPGQQRLYDELVEQGVGPRPPERHSVAHPVRIRV